MATINLSLTDCFPHTDPDNLRPVIEVSELTYFYPEAEKPVLSGVNLSVRGGEFAVLTGPTGCGKTTLCRCLNGLIPHFYNGKLIGKVMVAGLNVQAHPTNQLSQYVGFVFQNPENQLFSTSVERDVAFGLENMALPPTEIRRRVKWALEAVGISHLSQRPAFELSGGQQQKVAIACVLAMKPKIIVLDEPTALLDPRSASEILKVIWRLKEDLKATVIMVEHRLELAAKYASRVIVMNDGEIKLDGYPRTVFARNHPALRRVGVPKATRLHTKLLPPPVSLTSGELSARLRRALA